MATQIAATPKSAMNALAFKGIMVYSSFPQLRDMLLHKFGVDYVLLFARPEENLADGTIDWYSDVQGDPISITDLPEADRERIRSGIARMGGEILNYAEELIQSREELKVTRGNILKLALRYPDDSCLYVLGKQPVFTCWGFGPGTPGVEGKDIAVLGAAATAREQAAGGAAPGQTHGDSSLAPPQPGVRRAGCLWWLLPLIPLLLLLLLLFAAFGGRPALSGHSILHLPALPFMRDYADESGRMNRLEAENADLLERIAQHASMCQPGKGSQSVQPEEALVIPEKAEDAAFMEGEWRCDTGLANRRTGEPVKLTFFFGGDGRGKGMIYERNDLCEGEATAQMLNGVLHIELAEQICRATRTKYNAVSIDCDNAHGSSTRCKGINQDDSIWDASFRRMR